jgi:glycosyltransferase involved in cell wall biosynthesis
VLTPTLSGEDGLSCLARQTVEALATIEAQDVQVLALADAARPMHWPSHITVTGCGGRRAAFVWHAYRLARRTHRPVRVVVLHAHLIPAAWAAVRRGATLVPVLVGVEAWRPLSWARRRMFRRAPRAIAISHHTAARFRAANPRFASMPIDVCWPPTPSHADARDHAIHQRQPFALIVARLSAEDRYKGHDLLIDVWPTVRAAVPGARLVIAGTGDDQERLRARVAEAGLSDAIELVGRQTPSDLQALYRDCAFFVMPSRHEGFGLAFLEAMAAGAACIGARGAAEEIIVAESTGLIVDPDRPSDVCDAVIRLFGDASLRARFGEAGRRRAEEVFTMERFTAHLSQALAAQDARAMVAAC